MKARLVFTINANIKPEILIVDEVLSVGDKEFRLKCNAKINEIVESGVTFLFVTHSTSVAKDFCKRGIVMKQGKMIIDDTCDKAADFYEKMVAEEIKKRKDKEREGKGETFSVGRYGFFMLNINDVGSSTAYVSDGL